ncbi:hypothetical protein ACO2J1_02835 [Leptospira interrogans]|uniref:Uncharacterized protein n=3 Tax=Leptospira interrogans TaxID=173 RepID=A0A0E2D7B2_LEPIR|nr:hypothetical protein [Leptospira interrogans]EMF40336.1 hypothetical protein LEP1GSC067_2698 [Leptospira interrogans serovar Lora str. TE 1992]EMG10613.1 hypothetical protein LEP1GSC151_4905 [Leptospira interrogans serovar Grippotyphosa str. LT2186]AKH76041.1 hypothetical protein BRAT_02515 [Leptospira interrogans serovar Bratislava]ASV05043.1 hypothetical protein B2G47_01615 [Leptospira interrogans serovar Canicola]ASV08609.1 hypothetical protein B2G50_05745 [Leptospira interrogans serovar
MFKKMNLLKTNPEILFRNVVKINLILPRKIPSILWIKNYSYSFDFLTSERSPILKFALLFKFCISKIFLLPSLGNAVLKSR